MSKREFVLLAHKYDGKQHIGGWWSSEKLDGMRCVWDGGITRGLVKSSVPWANTAKDARYREAQISTGLWTRYGNVIHAPDWFLDLMPAIPLDGELYTRVANRQAIFSTIKDIVPSKDWSFIEYNAFDLVPFDFWLMDGLINNTGFKKSLKGCYGWAMERAVKLDYIPKPMTQFETTVVLMQQKLVENKILRIHPQVKLPLADSEAIATMQSMADKITEAGGEGVMVRSPISYWLPERSHGLLKYKPTEDMDGTVIGYTTGRETDKGSKLLGLMGALIIRLDNGKVLELSGFTDQERELCRVTPDPTSPSASEWAMQHPEEQCPDWIQATYFPRGTVITFKFRGSSDKGIPQEARYKCIRADR